MVNNLSVCNIAKFAYKQDTKAYVYCSIMSWLKEDPCLALTAKQVFCCSLLPQRKTISMLLNVILSMTLVHAPCLFSKNNKVS